MNANRTAVHFHIPRTGGTWLRTCLLRHFQQRYVPEQVFLVDLPNEYGFPFGSYAELENMDGRRRSRLRYVAGHMPIGVLDLFSNAFVFTALRDPVERALSDYWYCYHIAENPAHPFARQLSPGEFCRHGYGQAKNGIARYLSGAVYSDELMTDQEMRHKAIENLERFDLVGFQDDLQSLVKSAAHRRCGTDQNARRSQCDGAALDPIG